ncbi:MAG: diguanylate cyclase [Deltaproteobacteria bacterium]|nr:diguanylate cyclase [Deltaproteobacteria bacterium]
MNNDFEILLVEDSRTQALKFQLMLENHGYHIHVAQNGIEAMNMLLSNHFSIVVTDWVMPEMDGSELCRAIRQHDFGGYIYIILLTARDSKTDIIEGLKAGADDYLTKPVDDMELIARLSTAERIITLEKALRKRNREIALLSITDPLTRIFNRGYINDHLPIAFKRAVRYKQPLSVIISDIDHFKAVNDTHGHQAGDKVLIEFAAALKETLRTDLDWVARYGGEEFLIVLPETCLAGAKTVAERLRELVAGLPIDTGSQTISITASFGIATLSNEADTKSLNMDDLVKEADRCLYEAKEKGRNQTIGISL